VFSLRYGLNYSSSPSCTRICVHWPVPRQSIKSTCHISPFWCLRVVGGMPAASAQFLFNPDSSARAI
jgi:hypothetical protein